MLVTCLSCFEIFEVEDDEYEEEVTSCPICGLTVLQIEDADLNELEFDDEL